MFGKPKNKTQPVPYPREVRISRNPWKKTLKIFVLVALILGVGIGVWVGFSANRAIKKITAESNRQSSLFSLLGNIRPGNLKGQSEGRTNVLLLGMGGKNHPGGMLSDTMIVASVKYSDKKLGLLSLPRDLWVPIPGYGQAKINEAYAQGESNKKTFSSGGALASKTVNEVLAVPIHYFVAMDFDGFKKIVDTVGGVDIYVEKDIYDPSYPADNMIDYSPFKISAGLHHMDGNLALKYVRSRKTTSDFDRSRRQAQVMAAIKEKVLSLNILANPKKITDLINILGEHLRTNMQIDEMYAFWEVSKTIDKTDIITKVLDAAEGGPLIGAQDWRGYYIYPRKGLNKFGELQTMAKNIFEVAQNDNNQTLAKIEILNGTSSRGVASSVSEYLTSYGYNITNIGDAQTRTSRTMVYDFSQGRYQDMAQEIAAKLQANLDTKTQTSKVDIQVIVGEDYLR